MASSWPVPLYSGSNVDSSSSSWWRSISYIAAQTASTIESNHRIPSNILTYYQALIDNQTASHHLITTTRTWEEPIITSGKLGRRGVPASVAHSLEGNLAEREVPSGHTVMITEAEVVWLDPSNYMYVTIPSVPMALLELC